MCRCVNEKWNIVSCNFHFQEESKQRNKHQPVVFWQLHMHMYMYTSCSISYKDTFLYPRNLVVWVLSVCEYLYDKKKT